MACARVPLDEQQVTEPGPSGQEHTLPALVREYCPFSHGYFDIKEVGITLVDNSPCTVC